ncbi:hypothetical protein QYE88_42465, partial [Enterobacter hormaechei subsp. steigerwaltii]|nr:hypothetical protein [Enterobacter hormaechei subsp. steigerwaltii]
KIGERVRNSGRGREAMAGCRGAALTWVFVMPARARWLKAQLPLRTLKQKSFSKPAPFIHISVGH